MIAGLDVDVSELMADAVDAGIHIRIGLEDAPLFNRNTNVQLVEAAAAKIQRPTATSAEARLALRSRPAGLRCPGRHERLQKPARVPPLRLTAGAGKSEGVRKNRVMNEPTSVMHQGNAFKLGTLDSNCYGGRTNP